MTTVFRSRLTLPVLAAASSLFAISAPVQAQTACTLTGTNLLCLNGTTTVVSATVDATTGINALLPGLTLTDADTLTTVLSGTVTTNSATPAVNITAAGNLGVTGGLNAVNTAGPATLLTSTAGSTTAVLGTQTSVGGSYGATATGLTGATLTTGTVSATGITAPAPIALPIPGGVAGVGALAYSAIGPASLTVNGNLLASGSYDPVVGGAAIAPLSTASATVNGGVTATSTGGAAAGLAAIGATGATVSATGPVLVTSAAGANIDGAGLAALVTGTGTASVTCGSGVTFNGPNGSAIVAQGTNVTISCPNSAIAANGTGVTGVEATATGSALATPVAGIMNVNVGNVAVTGADGRGIVLEDLAGNINLTAGNISTTGANGTGLDVTAGTGTSVLTVGNVSVTGANATGIRASTGTGPLTLTAGQVSATGTGTLGAASGIVATSGGGALNVTTTGTATSANGFGILTTNAGTGTTTITTAGANGRLGGVQATTTGTGAVTVRTTGGTTTSLGGDAIRLATQGVATTTINAGANVQGQAGFDAIDTRGLAGNVVTVGGTLGVSGAGYAINSTGGAAAVTVQSGGNLVGPVLFAGTNNDTVTNNGSLSFTGTSDFGLGTDAVTNNNQFTLAGGATINGLETLTNSASGTTTAQGANTLTGTTFTNAGQLIATNGTASLAGLAAFNNSGLITLADGAANDTLTLGGNYTGSGNARLAVDVDGGLDTSDRLVVGGNIAGSTVIDVNLVNASATYNPTGALIVDGSGTVSANAFTLASADTQLGFLNYSLRQSGNDTYLASNLDPSFTDVALLGSLGQELWYQSFDAYHDVIMGRHAGSLDSGNSIGLHGQLYESKDRYGDYGRTTTVNGTSISYGDRLRTHRRGAQLGAEFRGTGFVIGATGGYEWARNEDDPSAARIKAEGWNYGAYALFGMQSGLYGGVLVKRDDYHLAFANDARAVSFQNKAHSTGVDGEIGLKTGPAGAIGFDLNAGLSYVTSDLDPWTQYGLTFDWQQNKSLRGRLGARVMFPSAMGAFIGAKVFHEFKDDGYLSVSNNANIASVNLPHRGTWARLEGGIAAGGAMITLWGDVGDTRSFGGRVGFRF